MSRRPFSNFPRRFVTRSLLVGACLVAAAAVGPVAGPGGAQEQGWVEPVSAPVVDSYRPPAHIGAPGNRGWEYQTEPGTVVVAAGDGVVAFVGTIGGSTYVSIDHPDGRRTTYSHVASVSVAVGDRVASGQPIARSGDRLHFGVRVGAEYQDPAGLFTTTAVPAGAPGARFGNRLLPMGSDPTGAPLSRTLRLADRRDVPAPVLPEGYRRWLATMDPLR